MRHTILGAGGSIGNALAFELLKKNENIRLVSRSNYSIPGTESIKADLTSFAETLKSVENSDIVYLCVGLPYDSKIWSELWPKIIQNSIDACKSVNARLISFDVFMFRSIVYLKHKCLCDKFNIDYELEMIKPISILLRFC